MASRAQQIAGHLNWPKGMLAGQVAIITGSGQGIGAEAARLFANEGAKVIVADIDAGRTLSNRRVVVKRVLTASEAKAADVAKDINESGGSAIAVAGDILDDNYIKNLVAKAAEFGNGKIHIIINNAGFTWDGVIHKVNSLVHCIDSDFSQTLCSSTTKAEEMYKPGANGPLQMTDKQWDTMLAVHNTAPFKLVRAAAPYFRVKDGEPRNIVNISSTSGVHGNAGQANYAVAKAGIIGLTKVIAKEWGPQFGVRANTVAFGHILTRLTQAKEKGAFVTTPDGEKIALGIPGKQQAVSPGQEAYTDIPLRRPGTATEAASAVLAVASPLFNYVNGQTIMVTGGRNM
jgi:3-oxoacyl-[acyl-carrier protein] reductase